MTTDGHDFPGSEPTQEPNFWPSDYQRHLPPSYPAQAPHPGPDYWYPPEDPRYGTPTQQHWAPTPPRKSRRGVAVLAAAAVMAFAIGGGVIAFSGGGSTTPKTSSFASPFTPEGGSGSSGSEGQTSPYSNGSGGTGSGSSGSEGQTSPFGFGNGSGTGSGSTGSGTTTTPTQKATSAQQIGIVDINTTIDYGQEQAAGTGMVLTANGEILTNNHVVNGATKISVTIVSTGKTFTGSVVGTDPTDDVAVIQLTGASGLATAKLGDSSKVAVGDAVTAVGNAGGTGGVPSAADGKVTALNQTITAGDENGSDSETLSGMIQTNADVQAGDSGGPLYTSSGSIIGMDTAASTGNQTAATGFAIPIAKATTIAAEIESGTASSKIHIGSAGFLGVQLQNDSGLSSGAVVEGVIAGSGAANAGLTGGDTITAVNGTSIADATALSTAVSGYKAGQQVSVSWTDTSGQSHTATVTLGTGPAD